jgi:hypothetical protein
MQGRKYQLAHLQSDFYRDQFRKIMQRLTYSIVIMFMLIAVILYLILFQPSLRYYANTSDGKILNMPHPMSRGV